MDSLDQNQKQFKKFLGEIMSDNIPEELDERMERALDSFREKLTDHPCYRNIETKPVFHWFPRLNLVWSTGFAAFILFFIAFSLLPSQPLTWADVAQQFKSISFFHATVNIKQIQSAEALQFEFWMGKGGNFRLQCGTQVVFANQEGIQKAFDIKSNTTVEPHDFLADVVNHINKADQFSLETVLNSFTGNFSDLEAVPNRVEGVSQDISTFDLKPKNTKETIRIWALRESMLPIFLKFSNVEKGIAYNTFFSYQQEQPDSFFDMQFFERNLGIAEFTSN